jgi:hypothetical protein
MKQMGPKGGQETASHGDGPGDVQKHVVQVDPCSGVNSDVMEMESGNLPFLVGPLRNPPRGCPSLCMLLFISPPTPPLRNCVVDP